MRRISERDDGARVISLVMPVHNPERSWLEEAIASVLGQAYPHLELCIADDASTQPHVRTVLDAATADARVRVVYRDQRGGIAAASNSALALATGEFVGFIDNDDVLRPHALYSMAAYLREHPDTDLVYSDEDKLLPDGSLGSPTFKPDFSPDRLLAENYVNHFTLVRRTLANQVGGFREGFDGSQDHDLMLRVAERAAHVGHVPDVLYAWRMVPGSTAVSAGFKPLAQDAGRRAVADALQRRDLEARVDLGPSPGLYVPRYALVSTPPIDIIVVARTDGTDAGDCVASIEQHTTYANRLVTSVIAGDHTHGRDQQRRTIVGGRAHHPARRLDARDHRRVDPHHARVEPARGHRSRGPQAPLPRRDGGARGNHLRTAGPREQRRSAPARHQGDERGFRCVPDDQA